MFVVRTPKIRNLKCPQSNGKKLWRNIYLLRNWNISRIDDIQATYVKLLIRWSKKRLMKQFNKDVIIVGVSYHLRYILSQRDIFEILRIHGIDVYNSTIYCWVQEYALILYQIWNRKNKKLIISCILMKHISKLKGMVLLESCHLCRWHTLDI